MQESSFWEGIDLHGLDELRLRLRGLVPFLDKKKRKIVYTDFQDEIIEVHEPGVISVPKMTGAEYEKKVKEYLRNHLDRIVIRRLRTGQPAYANHAGNHEWAPGDCCRGPLLLAVECII